MKRVRITFYVEPSDPDHGTGTTMEHYDRLQSTIASVGGDDIEFEVVEEEKDYTPGTKKPKK